MQTVKLGTLGTVITGKTPPTANKNYFNGDYPFITPSDISDYNIRRISNYERYLSEDWKQKSPNYLIPKNSICFVCIGSTVGKLILSSENSFTNQQINTLICDKEKADPFFLYYLLKTRVPQIKLIADSTGAGKGIINKSTFEKLELKIPEFQFQKTIGSVLTTYDDLIEINEKRIKILEEMTQRLYSEWFVKFRFPGYKKVQMIDSSLGKIPEGWKIVEMKNIAEVVDCLHSEKPKNINSGKNILLQLNNILDNGLIDLSEKYLISHEDYKKWTKNIELKEGDCVVTNVGRIAATGKIPVDLKAAVGRNMTAIRPLQVPASFLIQYLKSDHMKKEVKKKIDAGAIMSSLNVKNIYLLKVILPTENILNEFDNKVNSFIKEMEKLYTLNFTLIKIRDLLIPQLVTGRRELKN